MEIQYFCQVLFCFFFKNLFYISLLVFPYGAAALWETEEAEDRAGESWDESGECVS